MLPAESAWIGSSSSWPSRVIAIIPPGLKPSASRCTSLSSR
jgi:hypothetical protein